MDRGFERPGDDAIELIELDEPGDSGTAFAGRTARRSTLLRVGAVVGAAAVLVLSAALTMAASPAPSGSASGGAGPGASANPGGSTAPGSNPWAGGRWMMGGAFGRGPMMGFGRGMSRFGAITIAAIDGSSLSLRTADGWSRTITVTSTTKITEGGQAVSLGDLKVGDQIRFAESRGSDGTYAITAIEVVLPSVGGTVSAVTGDEFTVKGADGASTRVVVTGSTTYHLGRGAGSKADVKVGDRVAVEGTRASDGTITATTVRIAPAMIAGQVTARTSTSITVQLPGGTTTTVKVSGATSFRVAGKSSASLADIAIGDRIVAQGTQNADGSLQATDVASMAGGRGWGMGGNGFGGPMGGPMMGPGQGAPGFQG